MNVLTLMNSQSLLLHWMYWNWLTQSHYNFIECTETDELTVVVTSLNVLKLINTDSLWLHWMYWNWLTQIRCDFIVCTETDWHRFVVSSLNVLKLIDRVVVTLLNILKLINTDSLWLHCLYWNWLTQIRCDFIVLTALTAFVSG